MAISLNGTNQSLTNSTPQVTAEPITVGIWVKVDSISANRTIWALSDNGANSFIRLGMSGANVWQVTSQDSAGVNSTAGAGTVVGNLWFFIVGRWISSTLRYIDILNPDGSISQNSNAGSRTVSGLDIASLGRKYAGTNQWLDGDIAEFWWTDSDIYSAGNLTDGWIRQLAYGGPFSISSVQNRIMEYRSFRSTIIEITGTTDEVYLGRDLNTQTWTNDGGVQNVEHNSLPYWKTPPPNKIKTIVSST